VTRDVAVDIRERVTGTVTVLEPLGRMVLSESPTDDVLKERVAAQLREGRRQFIVDLHQVSQMDTSGLTTLVAAYIAVRKQQGRIVLVNPSGRVRAAARDQAGDVVSAVRQRGRGHCEPDAGVAWMS
jgi:anti-anti-sigma factor